VYEPAEKILDHRGIVLNEPIGALAHLQLARAYSLQGDTAESPAAYQDFLTLGKTPILTFQSSSRLRGNMGGLSK